MHGHTMHGHTMHGHTMHGHMNIKIQIKSRQHGTSEDGWEFLCYKNLSRTGQKSDKKNQDLH
jgi:hypothetical protein